METIKSYTDIERSKVLAEILPPESADMCYFHDGTTIKIDANPYTVCYSMWKDCVVKIIPCWSLAALLKELPETMLGKDNDGYVVMLETMGSGLTTFASNPVDACVDAILKLKDLNLI